LTSPAFKQLSSGGTLINPFSFIITDFNGNPLIFEIADHDLTTGFIAGSFITNLTNASNNFGYIYFNNPDVVAAPPSRNSGTLNTNAVASWHLPDKTNFKPGVANSDFNNNFVSTVGLRGAAAEFLSTSDIRTVSSAVLNGLTSFTIELMFFLTHLTTSQSLLIISSTDPTVNTELNIRTHNSPEATTPIDGLRIRCVGAGGDANYNYRSINLVINRWYHAVVTINSNGTIQLYLDGDLIDHETDSDTSAQGVATYTGLLLFVGGRDAASLLTGRIDDILVLQGILSANSAKWRARNSLYPDSSFTMAAMEVPGVVNDLMAGIYFDIANTSTFIIDIANYLVNPSGKTAIITSFTQPPSGEGNVTSTSTTQLKYTPPANFSGTPDFTITVSTS
jgi:hypothetical protein